MPSPLQNFLDREAEKLNKDAATIEAERLDWLAALKELFDQMEGWLKAVDHRKVLKIERPEGYRRDSRLGEYVAPSLHIHLGSRMVKADPVAYEVVGPAVLGERQGGATLAKGRVDLSSDYRKYKLYRAARNGQTLWFRLNEGPNADPTLLDQKVFEESILSLLV